jgi:hypothetical protein
MPLFSIVMKVFSTPKMTMPKTPNIPSFRSLPFAGLAGCRFRQERGRVFSQSILTAFQEAKLYDGQAWVGLLTLSSFFRISKLQILNGVGKFDSRRLDDFSIVITNLQALRLFAPYLYNFSRRRRTYTGHLESYGLVV